MSDLDKKQEDLILFKEHRKADSSVLAEIQLNNPKKLNVLNLEMIQAMNKKVREWGKREDISVLFIHSAGERAFCAGGDVVQVCSAIEENKKQGESLSLSVRSFFQTEYETDYRIHCFKKPVVVWGSGIVMGGGMGLLMAASHPILTETSLLAMPEIHIGFFPDVGASYFLNKIRNNIGWYLALTACRLNAVEARYLNISSWIWKNKEKQSFLNFLLGTSFNGREDLDGKLRSFYEPCLPEQENGIRQFEVEIIKALESKDLLQLSEYLFCCETNNKKWEQNRKNFFKASPTSLAVVFEQWNRSKNEKNLETLLKMELGIALHMAESHDFPEGVRALLIEKTGKPKWKPARIEDVNPPDIQKYFTPPDI